MSNLIYNGNFGLPVITTNSYIYTDTFTTIQKNLETHHPIESDYCGSTCLMAFEYIYEKKRYIDVVNLGDSRCIISRNNIANIITFIIVIILIVIIMCYYCYNCYYSC